MHRHRSSEAPEQFVRLDRVVLGLLVDPDDQRPWSEIEIAREISTPGHVPDSLERLNQAGLVHRYSGLVSATHSAVRLYEINQSHGPCERDRSLEEMILALLLDHPDQTPLSLHDVVHKMGGDSEIAIVDVLDSLGGAGLIGRSGELVMPSPAAKRYGRIMTL